MADESQAREHPIPASRHGWRDAWEEVRSVYGGGIGRRAAVWPRTVRGWVLVVAIAPAYIAFFATGLVLSIALFLAIVNAGSDALGQFFETLRPETADSLIKTGGTVLAAVLGYRIARKSDALRERAKALRTEQQPLYLELYDVLRRARSGRNTDLGSLERTLAQLTLLGSEKVVVLSGNLLAELRGGAIEFTPRMERDFLDLVFAMREDLGVPERELEDKHVLAAIGTRGFREQTSAGDPATANAKP